MTHEHPPLPDLAVRLIDASARIVSLHTGIGHDEAKAVCADARRAVLRELALPAWPIELPAAQRYPLVRRAIALVGDALRARDFSPETAQQVTLDLDTLFRGVNGLLEE